MLDSVESRGSGRLPAEFLGQSAARAPTSATPHHPQFPHKMHRRHLESVSAAHFYVEIVDRVPLPRCGGGERGCGAERRQWRMQRGGAPAAVEKIEQASSAKIFSGTARRRGQIRRGYLWSASVRSTDLFFPIIEGKTIFVSSTAKRQRGLSRGNSSPLTRFCLLLAVQKEAPAG